MYSAVTAPRTQKKKTNNIVRCYARCYLDRKLKLTAEETETLRVFFEKIAEQKLFNLLSARNFEMEHLPLFSEPANDRKKTAKAVWREWLRWFLYGLKKEEPVFELTTESLVLEVFRWYKEECLPVYRVVTEDEMYFLSQRVEDCDLESKTIKVLQKAGHFRMVHVVSSNRAQLVSQIGLTALMDIESVLRKKKLFRVKIIPEIESEIRKLMNKE